MYPIRFDADYEVERNRLTTFFRPLVAIPWILWAYLYGLAAGVVVIIAWLAVLFTKRYPSGMYDFVANYLRFQTRVVAFIFLLTDEFPPFGGGVRDDYPVRVGVAPPQPEYRRSRTFFKYLLVLPQQILLYGVLLMAYGASVITWFRVLVTGRQSITMHDALQLGFAYFTRVNGFLYLLTEAHPRLLEVTPKPVPVGAPGLLYSGEDPEFLPPARAQAAGAATVETPPPAPPAPPRPEA